VAKGADVTIAVNKAVSKAKKHLITIRMRNNTIPHEIHEKFGAAKIILKPAPLGTGIIAGGAVRTILELSGIKDVVGKILGSKNKINNIRATINALQGFKKTK
jgi:small subunit ribosomal protein S5